MKKIENNEIFSEIKSEESAQINGGSYTMRMIGATLGNMSSSWWLRNFRANVNSGNINGALAVTDRSVRALTNRLAAFGINVPRY
jgi:hypothetical protein